MVIKLAEKGRNRIRFFSPVRKNHADYQRKQNDRQHLPACQRPQRIGWDNLKQGICHAQLFPHSSFRSLYPPHIQPCPRIDQACQQYGYRNGDSRGQQIKSNGLHTDLSQPPGISNCHAAADKGAENQRNHQHLHQPDKPLPYHIKNTVDNHLIPHIPLRRPKIQRQPRSRPKNQCYKYNGCQIPFLFLHRSSSFCNRPDYGTVTSVYSVVTAARHPHRRILFI